MRAPRPSYHDRRIAILVSALVLAYAHSAAGACAPQPLHAQATVLGGPCRQWECLAGYFRTAPADPSLATCRACRTLACPAGYAAQACNATSDTFCARCPGADDPNVLFAAGCSSPRCADGWLNRSSSSHINRTSSACSSPCPEGSYCVGGVQRGCGVNGTTLAPGASSLLQCAADSIGGGAWLAVTFDFSVADTPLQGDPVATCGLEQQLEQILVYGTFSACTTTARDPGRGLLWSASCYAGAAPDAVGQLTLWIGAMLRDASVLSSLQFFMATVCARRSDVLVGSAWVQPQALTPALLSLLQQAAQQSELPAAVQAPLGVRPLQYAPAPAWGTATADAVAVTAALGIAGTAVPIGLMMACAGVCSEAARRSRWHDALHEMEAYRGLHAA